MQNYIFAGIDLGDKKSVARIAVNRENSERFTFINTKAGRYRLFGELKRRVAQLRKPAKIVMAYEASSCGFVLQDEAQALKMQCSVLAPTKMEKSVEQKKHKNDDRDGEDVLEKVRAHVLAGNKLPTVWVPDVATRDDRELVRCRLDVADKQTQIKAQIQMLLKRFGIEKPSSLRGWSTFYEQWLDGLSQGEELGWGTRHSLASLLRQLRAIQAELQQLDAAIKQLSKHERHEPIVQALMQEKGVGLLTAMVYRSEIGSAGRFRRGRRMGKYVGLTPSSHESGQQQDRKGHITRQGSPRLRKVLCQAGWSHLRHDAEAREFYLRLVAKNPKKKKIAVVAVMRKLAIRLWHRMRVAEAEMVG